MPGNERRPGGGTGATKTIAGSGVNAHCTASTDNYPVTGTLVVDLAVLARELSWWELTCSSIRTELVSIEQMPRGSHVRLVVGDLMFLAEYIYGIRLDHVSITVESDNPSRLRQWIVGLREARG